MDLWIRSQDREKFVKCNDIAIRSFIFNEIPKKEWSYSIVGYFDKNTEYETLGFYKTKERALEVLDDIQNKIIKGTFTEIRNGLNELKDIKPNPIYVYEMPLE